MVILAKHAGFCFGVRRAVDAVEKNISQNLVTLGPLIHNRHVVSSLEARGVRCVQSVDDIQKGETAVIRSHGMPPEAYERLAALGIPIIDETCPFVKRIHDRVLEARDAGLPVIIVGEIGHPEIVGIIGWAGEDAHVVYSEEDVSALPDMDEAVVVAQTTLPEKKWEEMCALLHGKAAHLTEFCSICSATRERQDEAKEIAEKSDCVLVVGGKTSSNTQKLFELCKRYCKNTYHIEDINELSLEKMRFDGIIGIVAGASTPDTMIREVLNYMIENEKVLPIEGEEIASEVEAANDAVDESAEAASEASAAAEDATEASEETTETAAPEASTDEVTEASETEADNATETSEEPEEASAQASEEQTPTEPEKQEPITEQDEFLEGLEKVISLKKGQLVKGNIVQITDEDVCVNIGYKSDGIIPKNELSLTDENAKDALTVGDEIEAEVISLNDGEGNVLLSRRRVEKKQNWIKMQENVGTDKVYSCVVKKAVKGGVTTKVDGYSTFIPASHLSLKYIEDLKQFEGQEIEVTLIDADKRQERLVASHKTVLLKEKKEKEAELWNNFNKGEHITGTVKRLTDFGAFVDVGGVDGLLHISDLAWSRVKHPSDIVSEGQEIEMLILNVDTEKKKIALGYKQLQPKPWDLVPEKYHEGDVVMGKVVRIVPFGAFVQLEPTVDGLVHISQVTTHRLERVEDELRLGDEIEVKILEVNADKRKISLSRKALLAPEDKPAERKEKFARDDHYNYELPPVQESTVSLADFFPKDEE